MLADTTWERLQEQVLLWKSHLSQYGLRLNLNKTEYLETNLTTHTIEVDGSKLNKTNAPYTLDHAWAVMVEWKTK